MAQIDRLVAVIELEEGFGRVGKVPTRLNNPGDLMFARQLRATPVRITGADGKVRIYASFPTVADGLHALTVQIALDAGRGLTLAQFVDKYAPGSDGNNPRSYLFAVVRALGVRDGSVLLADALRDVPAPVAA